ncbi:MAG: ATP-dependent helicase [Acidimicrobiia bacterium]
MSDPRQLLRGLDPTQREAVTSEALPLAVLAGAGSGKTRVLTHRIAWHADCGGLDPNHTLAVTFTRKAASELRTRCARLGINREVTAGTFHAVAFAQLRGWCADRGQSMPTLLERKARLLGPMLGPKSTITAAEVAGEIEWAKARLVRPGDYEGAVTLAGRRTPRPAAEMTGFYRRYEQERRRRRLLDFDDLVHWCAHALETDAEFAAAQRWRYRHLLVDEFQDVNPAQFRLLWAWLGDRTDLCVVGDPDQSIYGFAGADAGYLDRVTKHLPGVTVVRLGVNYRSTEPVVRAARAVLASGDRAPATPAGDGPAPSTHRFESDTAEATGVARLLRKAHGPDRPWSSMAVLYRTNAQSVPFEEAFRRAGVPYRIRGDRAFLQRPEVKAALADLRRFAADSPGADMSSHLADLDAEAAELPDERREHLAALVRLGQEYCTVDGRGSTVDGRGATVDGCGATVDGFVEWLATALRGGDGDDRRADAVELLTFHRAKGLEWETVIVTGLERGLVPIARAETPAARAEERRLLYVAISRSRRNVHLTWAAQRTFGLRTMSRRESPWLDAIVAAVSPACETKRATAVSGPSRARAALGNDQVRDPQARALFARLVEWRRTLARAAAVPAYVIFPDRTLDAVASARPRSHDELAGLPGIGPVKLERYGDAVLDLVASG